MHLEYFQSPHGNLGDDLNSWFWDEVLPGFRDYRPHPEASLLGVGTILNEALPRTDAPCFVVGSGVGYGRPPRVGTPGFHFVAVRGPLSARSLGADRSLAIVDPAVLIPGLAQFQGVRERQGTVFVPHWESDLLGDWARICQRAGITCVSPRGESRGVIHRIASAHRVLAESLHAAIVADAFRVPWTPVITHPGILRFKWMDWAASVGARYAPVTLPGPTHREQNVGRSRELRLDPLPRPQTMEKTYGEWQATRARPLQSAPSLWGRCTRRLRRLQTRLGKLWRQSVGERGAEARRVDRTVAALLGVCALTPCLSPMRDFQRADERLRQRLDQFRASWS